MHALNDRVKERQHKRQQCNRLVTTDPQEWISCVRVRAGIGYDQLRAYPCGFTASGGSARL